MKPLRYFNVLNMFLHKYYGDYKCVSVGLKMNLPFKIEDLKPQQLVISSNNVTFNSLKKGITEYIKTNKTNLYEKVVGPNTNPYPFLVSKLHLHELKGIQEALYFAIKSVVQNYDKDSRIKETYNFSNEIKNLLDLCNEIPYENIGGYRPDYLYEAGTLTPKICEINARFPINGYLMTVCGYDLINEYPELFNCFDGHFDYSNFKFEVINEIQKVENVYEKVLDINKPIAILKNKEYGNDVHLFANKYKNTLFMDPSDLAYDNERRCLVKTDQNGINMSIDQIILELHQNEILALPENIIKTIIKSCKHFNDLRTIFIAHDKRFLTILSRDDILADYLDPFYHDIIKKHRIQSLLTNSIQKQSIIYKKIIENKNDWLIKPCLLGKGQGIVFGKDIAEIEWKCLIESCLNENKNQFIIQKYVKQEQFDYFDGTICSAQNDDLKLKHQNVVGTLLCFNDLFMGPGIFRTSSKDLIALRQDGSLMFPIVAEFIHGIKTDEVLNGLKSETLKQLLLSENGSDAITKSNVAFLINEPPHYKNHKPLELPESTLFKLSTISFKDVPLYERALIKHGIALIELNFNDSSSLFMLDLIRHLGIPHAHSSKNDDYLWDIKPMNPNNVSKTNARSHADSEFLMHTDASFEKNIDIPRFFGLHVLTHDKYQGGQSLLIKLDDILMNLEKDEIEILCNQKFKFKIPEEFRKDNKVDYSIGTILSFDKLNQAICRYRHDIIIDINEKSEKTKKVVKKFENLLDIENSNLIKYFQMQSNTIILVDNCRYLHGRTEIKDSNRHLRRVRFQAKYNQLLPSF